MISDAMTSIKAYLYERAASPLLGSLIVSWCAWNHKVLLLWVSGLSYPEKLSFTNYLYSTNYEVYGQGMLLPFITAMVYLFAFPYPAKFVYEFSLNRQKELLETKNEIEDNKQLTIEQSRAIRQQLADVERESDELIERKDRAIESRDREIASLQEQLAELQRGNEAEKEGTNEREGSFKDDNEHQQETSPKSDTNSEGVKSGADSQKPNYLKYYEAIKPYSLDLEIVSRILKRLVSSPMDKDFMDWLSYDLHEGIGDVALMRIIKEMVSYDLLEFKSEDTGEARYYIKDNGEALYKYIMENPYVKEDEISESDESDRGDVSFYFDADKHQQGRYKRILEGLFLEDRRKDEFGLASNLFDAAMVQLILHNLVVRDDIYGKYSITDEGRKFYTNLNKNN